MAIAMSIYVLVWPVVVAAVLFVISRAFYREWSAARRRGEDLI